MPHDTLRDQQFRLARHLRDPSVHAAPPGLEARRLRVYRELFFGNIRSLLAGGFPVIRRTLGETRWTALVHAFYAKHRSRTPLFAEIASEFVGFVEAHADTDELPPWLPELAHYEWIEQLLFVSDAPLPPHDPDGDLFVGIPVLSPLALPLAYRWPVAEIGPDFVPEHAPEVPTTLLVHRDAQHQIRFARITPIAYRLLAQLQEQPVSGYLHTATLAEELGVGADALEPHVRELLTQLRAQGVVLGTATEPVGGASAPMRGADSASMSGPASTDDQHRG